MAAAAEDLVPVILELGGKSPVLVHPSIDLQDVAQRLAAGKLGIQVKPLWHRTICSCLKVKTAKFTQHFKAYVQEMYRVLSTIRITPRLFNDKLIQPPAGLSGSCHSTHGAKIIELNRAHEDLSKVRKIAPTIVTSSRKCGL